MKCLYQKFFYTFFEALQNDFRKVGPELSHGRNTYHPMRTNALKLLERGGFVLNLLPQYVASVFFSFFRGQETTLEAKLYLN